MSAKRPTAHDERVPSTADQPSDVGPPPLTAGRLFGRALRRRCPVCGGGGIFHRWVSMEERCPTCGFRFERIEGHWIGSLGLNTIITFGLGMLVLGVGYALMHPDPNIPVLLAAVLVVAVAGPLVLFPWTRTLWSAADLLMRPLDPDDEVDPDHLPGGGPPE